MSGNQISAYLKDIKYKLIKPIWAHWISASLLYRK